MVRWIRWHCPTDTGFEIRALAVWGRTSYISVTLRVSGEKTFFVSLKIEGHSGVRSRDLWLPKQAASITAPGQPAPYTAQSRQKSFCPLSVWSSMKWALNLHDRHIIILWLILYTFKYFFITLEVVGRGSETQLQVWKQIVNLASWFQMLHK